MKTNRSTYLVTAAFCFAAFSNTGCTEKEKKAETSLPAAADMKTTTATAVASAPTSALPAATAAAASPAATVNWADLQGYGYDARANLFTGLKQFQTTVDMQVSELRAKRAAMPSTANTKDWDFAMKEMENAQSYLKDMGEELGKASAENWDQQKEKVGQAWVRAQAAYDKVKTSITS